MRPKPDGVHRFMDTLLEQLGWEALDDDTSSTITSFSSSTVPVDPPVVLDISTSFEQIRCEHGGRCNRPDCIICQSRKSSNKAHIATHNLKDKQNLYLVSLTIAGNKYDTTKAKIGHLRSSFKRLQRSSWWQSKVVGGLYGLDASYSEDTGFNPHLHLVIESDPINKSDLRQQWLKVGGGVQIDLKAIGPTERDKYRTSRYCLKPALLGFKDRPALKDEWLAAVGRQRKSDRFGSWRNTSSNPTRWTRPPRPEAAPEAAPEATTETFATSPADEAGWREEASAILGIGVTDNQDGTINQGHETQPQITGIEINQGELWGKTHINPDDWMPTDTKQSNWPSSVFCSHGNQKHELAVKRKTIPASTLGAEIRPSLCGLDDQSIVPTTTSPFDATNGLNSSTGKRSTCSIAATTKWESLDGS